MLSPMRLKLWQTWFLFTAGLVLLALGANHWAQTRDFRRGLLGYVNALEAARLPTLAQRLAEVHSQRTGLGGLTERPGEFARLMSPGEPGHESRRPPPPPPPMGALHGQTEPQRSRRNEQSFLGRLSVLDADGRRLLGPGPSREAVYAPIVSNGREVGRLALNPMPALEGPLDIEFARAQGIRALGIASAVLLVALLSALLLARKLGDRLGRLASASEQVAAGDFGVRVDERGADEISQLGRDFNRMAAALDKNRAARDRWIADISHELRTPLTVLRGELAALQDRIRPLNWEAIDSLAAEAERLSTRVDDLYALTLSDQGSLSYRFTGIDASSLLDACQARHGQRCRDAGLSLRCDPPAQPLTLSGDPARLEQLLDNLLQNSCRYTARGGHIELRAHAQAASWVVLCLEDSSPGPNPDELHRLTERRYRGAGAEHVPEGGGLGLSICENIAQAHGGRLRFGPSSLGGLKVEVWLPAEGRRR
jgi:two-component system sensor histidine kinase BaeS